jgi:hypothetical protein
MANAGEVFIAYSNNLADAGTLDAQPAAGGEAVIHNIYHGGAVEIYFNDGTNTVLIDSAAAAGVMSWLCYHVTNAKYITIKNVSGGAADVGYDGMYTHATS